MSATLTETDSSCCHESVNFQRHPRFVSSVDRNGLILLCVNKWTKLTPSKEFVITSKSTTIVAKGHVKHIGRTFKHDHIIKEVDTVDIVDKNGGTHVRSWLRRQTYLALVESIAKSTY